MTKPKKIEYYDTVYSDHEIPDVGGVSEHLIPAVELIELLKSAQNQTYAGDINKGAYLHIEGDDAGDISCRIKVKYVETDEAYAQRLERSKDQKYLIEKRAKEKETQEYEMYLKLKAKYEASALPKEESDG